MPELAGMDNKEDQLLWLEEDAEEDNQYQDEPDIQEAGLTVGRAGEDEHRAAVAALEEELQRTRKELMDVRKELAAKTVQLSRKEMAVSQEKVAELAATVASEKDKQLASLAAHVEQLEAVLGQKEEELEESRRMYAAQKRALREALSAAAEAEAAERQADEARARTAVAQAVEDELEQLQHELALLQARYDLEMRARDAELQSLRRELQIATTNRKQAVAAAEAALTEAWQAEVERATADAEARVAQLEAELARVRLHLEEATRNTDAVGLAGELASLNQQKVAIQREFDAFKEMATASARQNREDAAKLLEENANLKSRLAARAFQDVQAGFKPQSKVFSALTSGGGTRSGSGGLGAGTGEELGPGAAWLDQLPGVLSRWERKRKGIVPVLVLGSLAALFVLVAVIRAAAVTRSEHRGGLCFLAHLGINVGTGCGVGLHPQTVSEAASEQLGALLDQAPRVHDIELAATAAGTGGAVAAGTVAGEAAEGAEAAVKAGAKEGAAAEGEAAARAVDGSGGDGSGGGTGTAAPGKTEAAATVDSKAATGSPAAASASASGTATADAALASEAAKTSGETAVNATAAGTGDVVVSARRTLSKLGVSEQGARERPAARGSDSGISDGKGVSGLRRTRRLRGSARRQLGTGR